MRQLINDNNELTSSFTSSTMIQIIGRMYNQRVNFASVDELIEITRAAAHYKLVAITSFVTQKWDAICAGFNDKQKASNLCRDFLLVLGFDDDESKLVKKVSRKMQRLARDPYLIRPDPIVDIDDDCQVSARNYLFMLKRR